MPRPQIDELRAVAQPPEVMSRRNGEHWVSLLYGRWLSLRLTQRLAATAVSPTAVTVGMVAVGLLATLSLTLGGVLGAAICAVGIQVYLVLDCVDGELARWRRATSTRGVYLDRLGHYLVESALFTAFGWRVGGGFDSGWMSIGLATALLAVLTKAESDLVLAAVGPDAGDRTSESFARPRNPWIRRARAVAHPLKVHRSTGAVEASLLILAAALLTAAGVDHAEPVLALAFLVVSALLLPGHGVAILSSRRLD